MRGNIQVSQRFCSVTTANGYAYVNTWKGSLVVLRTVSGSDEIEAAARDHIDMNR